MYSRPLDHFVTWDQSRPTHDTVFLNRWIPNDRCMVSNMAMFQKDSISLATNPKQVVTWYLHDGTCTTERRIFQFAHETNIYCDVILYNVRGVGHKGHIKRSRPQVGHGFAEPDHQRLINPGLVDHSREEGNPGCGSYSVKPREKTSCYVHGLEGPNLIWHGPIEL